MEGQLRDLIRQKIIDSLAAPVSPFTRRDIQLPGVKKKAVAVIGMRRTGKTELERNGSEITYVRIKEGTKSISWSGITIPMKSLFRFAQTRATRLPASAKSEPFRKQQKNTRKPPFTSSTLSRDSQLSFHQGSTCIQPARCS